MTNTAALNALFGPQSIAVVGVSRDAVSVGSTIYANIIENGFKGSVFPVNPFIQEFHQKVCYPSVLAIPQTIDLAVVVVPASVVPSVLEEIGKKEIPLAIIISSGFSEIGAEGLNREIHIRTVAKKYKIALLGPNCLGVIHPHEKINASFARTQPIPGSIAFISQSGALGAALLDIITPKGIGLSHFISLGNKADINELNILEYLSSDQTTSVIGLYVEQLRDAKELIAVGKKMATNPNPKPIVILKGGRTKEGTEAVHSHTGSLAGIPEAYSALFDQACMMQAYSTQEFINTLVCFSQNPIPSGNSCAVLTNAGGPAILATDTLISSGVIVPSILGNHNPIDLLGDAQAKEYQEMLSKLESEESVHSILGIVTPQAVTKIADTANAFCIHKKTSKKPLAVSWMGDQIMKEGKEILDMGHIPVSKYPEQTAVMLSNLHKYASMRNQISKTQSEITPSSSLSSSPIDTMDPLSIVKSLGIPVPSYVCVKDIQSIPPSLSSLGDTIVIKLILKQIIHKTDSGAIRVNVPKGDAERNAAEMLEQVQKIIPSVIIDSILLMDMVNISEGLECIVGIKKEAGLGTLIMLGVGGIFVEVMKDVTFRFAPLMYYDADQMIHTLKSSAVFHGTRGKQPLDRQALIEALLKVSSLAINHPEITELDINPLLVKPKGQGVIALDCRLTVTM